MLSLSAKIILMSVGMQSLIEKRDYLANNVLATK